MNQRQVKQFYAEYSKAMGIRVVGVSILSRVLRLLTRRIATKYAKLLPALEEAMRPMSVRFGRAELVFLTFDVGDAGTPFMYQIDVIAHEAEHTEQIRDFCKRGGTTSAWYREYFTDDDFRAMREGGARAAAAELRFAMYGAVPSFASLDNYLVSPAAVALAKRAYQPHIDKVTQHGRGSSTFKSSRVAIEVAKKVGII